jgi:hypothetical protein
MIGAYYLNDSVGWRAPVSVFNLPGSERKLPGRGRQVFYERAL